MACTRRRSTIDGQRASERDEHRPAPDLRRPAGDDRSRRTSSARRWICTADRCAWRSSSASGTNASSPTSKPSRSRFPRMFAARRGCSIDYRSDLHEPLRTFTFKLTVPNDPEGATVVSGRGRLMPWNTPAIDAAAGAAFVERVRAAALKCSRAATGKHTLVVFAAADGQLTVTIGGKSISQPLAGLIADASLQHPDPATGGLRPAARQHRPHVHLRPHGLRARAHRQLPHVRLRGRAAPRA